MNALLAYHIWSCAEILWCGLRCLAERGCCRLPRRFCRESAASSLVPCLGTGRSGKVWNISRSRTSGKQIVADIVRDRSVIVLHTFTFDLSVTCCTELLSLAQRLALHALLLSLAGRTFFLNLDLVAASSFRESPCHVNFLISDGEVGWRGYPVRLLTTVVFGLRVV